MSNRNLNAQISMEALISQRPKLDFIKNENTGLKINKFKFLERRWKRYLDIEYLTDIIKKRSYTLTGEMNFLFETGKIILKICYAVILLILLTITVTAQELTIENGAEFSLGSSTLILSGDWVNDGTFNADDGEVIFNGAEGNQSITGNEIEFNNLTVNKASGTLNLKNSISVKGTLSVLSGTINGNNHAVTLGSNALLNETGGNTIAEGVITTIRTLNAPSGVNILGVVITSSSNLGTTTITRGHAPQNGEGNSGILRYYDIVPANNNNLNATLIFTYSESELNGLSEEGLTLFGSTDNGTTWAGLGGVLNLENNTITLSGVNHFSRFTLGSNSSPLPVELVSFSGQALTNSVKLIWETATEVNNYGFDIERRSLTPTPSQREGASEIPLGMEWGAIGFIQGAGNSSIPKAYEFTDKYPSGGTKFLYRLKQIDHDGTYKYSNEVEVTVIPVEFHLAQNYPNPFNPITSIEYRVANTGHISLKVYDILGKEVAILVNELKQPGIYKIDFNASSLASGTYIYRLFANGFVDTKKLILMK